MEDDVGWGGKSPSRRALDALSRRVVCRGGQSDMEEDDEFENSLDISIASAMTRIRSEKRRDRLGEERGSCVLGKTLPAVFRSNTYIGITRIVITPRYTS